MYLSPELWLTGRRAYPLTPVFPFLPSIPSQLDMPIYGAILLLAVAAVFVRSVKLVAALILVAAVYALFDQSRWQPWFYQYLLMLAALCDPRPARALATCRFIVAAVYFWSGLHKLNPGFVDGTFAFMVAALPGGAWLHPLAYLAPVLEAAIGVALLTRRFRRAAACAAIAMHVFILAAIGPLGHNFDSVVWPWNIAMICLVAMLFRTGELWRPVPVWAILLCGLAPAFNFFDLWDGYLSFALYSGNSNYAEIYIADDVAGRLPDAIQQRIDVNDSKVDELDLMEWSYDELNVPAYSEPRVYRNILRHLCALTEEPDRMVLVIDHRAPLFGRRSRTVEKCR